MDTQSGNPSKEVSKLLQSELEQEEWRDVPGYEGRYQASSLGRIMSLLTNKILLECIINGRPFITLYRKEDGTSYKFPIQVHKIITYTFLGETPHGMEIDHINGVKTDNKLSNLEFVTKSENIKRAVKLGLIKPPHRGFKENHSGYINKERRELIRKLYESKEYTIRALAAKFSHSQVTIFRIIHELED